MDLTLKNKAYIDSLDYRALLEDWRCQYGVWYSEDVAREIQRKEKERTKTMEQTEYEPEILPPAIIATTAIEAISRADYDVAISTAKRFPMHSDKKQIDRFRVEAIAMATIDIETAQSCLYTLERKDRHGRIVPIKGPSIRLAEILASAYGNIRTGARVISIDRANGFVTAQGVCHDLEKNNYMSCEVQRRITGKNGKLFGEDMIGVTCNAAMSIALRNAIFKVIPAALSERVYQSAITAATGDNKTLEIRRAKAIELFRSIGVDADRILHKLNKPTIDAITPDDITLLIGYFNAIQNGEQQSDEVFPVAREMTIADPAAFDAGAPADSAQEPVESQSPPEQADQPKRILRLYFHADNPPGYDWPATLEAAGFTLSGTKAGPCYVALLNTETAQLAEEARPQEWFRDAKVSEVKQ